MTPMEKRVDQLEQKVSQLTRELSRALARPAAPKAPRLGRFIGKLQSNLTQSGTATVTISIFNGTSFEETAAEIEDVHGVLLPEGQELQEDTYVLAFFYENCWVCVPFIPANPWYLGITRETFTQGVDEFVEVDIYEWQFDKWRKITVPPDGFVSARDWFLNKDEVLEKKTKVRVDYYRTTWVVTAMYCSPTDLDEFDDVVPPSPGELEQLANQQPFDGGGVMMPVLGNGPDSGLVLFPDGDSETQNFPWFPNS